MVLFLLTVTTQSQVLISILFGDKLNTDKMTFGLVLGNGWNNLTGYTESDAQANFNLGIFLTFKLQERLFLQFDALAKYKLGAKRNAGLYELGEQLFEKDMKESTTLFDVGLATGTSWQFSKGKGLELGVRCFWGLVDLYPSDAGTNAARSLASKFIYTNRREKANIEQQ